MEKDLNQKPIIVFDSGVGGISVLRELIKLMPNEDFIYFGDSANAPYGMKSLEEVKKLTLDHIGRLLKAGGKAVCVACNTATSAAVKNLRNIYPNTPIVGIEPALKPAATMGNNPKVLVLATPMTIREGKFQNLLKEYEDMAEIIQLPCPGLMEFIEGDKYETAEFNTFLHQLLWDYENNFCDAAVLGCTHYSFVRDKIQKALGDRTKIFDGAYGTAKELKRRIKEAGLEQDSDNKGSVIFQNSNMTPEKLALCEKLVRYKD